jgi:hypothetical protein
LVALVELEAGAEEFRGVRGGYYGAGTGGAEDALDVVEGGYYFLAEGAVEAVLGWAVKSNNEDVAIL